MVLFVPLAAFFGFIGLSLFLLCFSNRIATKYLNGDFLKSSDGEHTEESDEGELSEYGAVNELHQSEANLESSIGNSRDLVGSVDFTNPEQEFQVKPTGNKFADNAKVNLSLEYNNDKKILTGSILGMEDLSRDNPTSCPDLICYHIKLKPPSGKSRVKTVWKDLGSGATLAFDFKLGPFKKEVLLHSNICFRLYGKKKRFGAKLKCLGESVVPLSAVTQANGPLIVTRRVLPKSGAGDTTENEYLSVNEVNNIQNSTVDSMYLSERTSEPTGVPQGSLGNLYHGEDKAVNASRSDVRKTRSSSSTHALGSDTVIDIQ